MILEEFLGMNLILGVLLLFTLKSKNYGIVLILTGISLLTLFGVATEVHEGGNITVSRVRLANSTANAITNTTTVTTYEYNRPVVLDVEVDTVYIIWGYLGLIAVLIINLFTRFDDLFSWGLKGIKEKKNR